MYGSSGLLAAAALALAPSLPAAAAPVLTWTSTPVDGSLAFDFAVDFVAVLVSGMRHERPPSTRTGPPWPGR